MHSPSHPGIRQPLTEKRHPVAPSAQYWWALGTRSPCSSLLRGPSRTHATWNRSLEQETHHKGDFIHLWSFNSVSRAQLAPGPGKTSVAAPTTSRLTWVAFSHKHYPREEPHISSTRNHCLSLAFPLFQKKSSLLLTNVSP